MDRYVMGMPARVKPNVPSSRSPPACHAMG
jgi:hypothetical protein